MDVGKQEVEQGERERKARSEARREDENQEVEQGERENKKQQVERGETMKSNK